MIASRPSRLIPFCEGVVEAAWLGAVVVTALFFNYLSFRSFEPDKAELFRAIALVAALAWLVRGLHKAVNSGRGAGRFWPRGRLFGVPLLVPVLALWLSIALSTALSVDWHVSLFGSYGRRQGLYTVSAYLVLFSSVLALLRSRYQFDRLVTTLIVVTVPVSVLGLMQHQGIDPIPWSGAGTTPVVSTMGNTIFVAAWLVMIVPLLLHRLVESLGAATRALPKPATVLMMGFVVVLVGVLLLAWPRSLRTAATISAGSLGIVLFVGRVFRARLAPWLRVWSYAVVLAAAVACVLLTERRGPFLGMLTGVFLFALLHLATFGRWKAVLGMVGAAALALVTLISAPTVAPSLLEDTPFARLTQVLETGGSARVRLRIWDSVIALTASDPLRAVVGHGPDTLHLAVAPFSHPAIAGARESLTDRGHSETMDVLAGSGLLGLLAYGLFVTCLFMLALRWTGLTRGARARRLFLVASGLTALVFVIAVRALDGSWRLVAVALPAALLFATSFVIVAVSLRELSRRASASRRPTRRQRWSATLFGALAAHLVEVHVGIGTVATQATFWILVAAMVVVGHRPEMLGHRSLDTAGRRIGATSEYNGAPGADPSTIPSLIPMGILVALLIVTLAFNFPLRHFAAMHSESILWLFGMTGLLTGAIVLGETWADSGPATRRFVRIGDAGVFASIVLLSFSVAGFAFSLTAMPGLPPVAPLLTYLGIVAVMLIALAFALRPRPNTSVVGTHHWAIAVYVCLLGATVWAIASLNLRPLQADMLFKRGLMNHHRQGQYQEATSWYRRAIMLAPDRDHYYLQLGLAQAEQALRQGNPAGRNEIFGHALSAVVTAQALRPLHPAYPETLARLHLRWAQATDDPERAGVSLSQALVHFDEARKRNPNRSPLWIQWGNALDALGRYDAAIEKYRQAVLLDADSLVARESLAKSLQRGGERADAVRVYRQIIERWPEAVSTYAALIHLYLNNGDCRNARSVLQQASGIVHGNQDLGRVANEVATSCAP